MKLLCKLFGHKWGYFSLIPQQLICKRCGLEQINRSDLDESENVIFDKESVNQLWDRCIKHNSYTNMGSEIRFDKMADMVIGENKWYMRDQALLTIKSMGKLLTPEKKIEILKASGVSKSDINSCYREE